MSISLKSGLESYLESLLVVMDEAIRSYGKEPDPVEQHRRLLTLEIDRINSELRIMLENVINPNEQHHALKTLEAISNQLKSLIDPIQSISVAKQILYTKDLTEDAAKLVNGLIEDLPVSELDAVVEESKEPIIRTAGGLSWHFISAPDDRIREQMEDVRRALTGVYSNLRGQVDSQTLELLQIDMNAFVGFLKVTIALLEEEMVEVTLLDETQSYLDQIKEHAPWVIPTIDLLVNLGKAISESLSK